MAKSILIVEDHPAVRTMLTSLFTNNGYQVTSAEDGKSGLAFLAQGGFSAVLLDLNLPEYDGFSILKAIHQQPPQTPNGPIIVFSNNATEDARQQSLQFGAAAFIPKDDLTSIKLVEQIEKLTHQPQ